MGESVESSSPEVVSSEVSDLRDAPLVALVTDSAALAEGVIDRVLDLEANGLLTASAFNASI
jgi:hypothetical protein